jgi:iron complex outermembrane receptor protein
VLFALASSVHAQQALDSAVQLRPVVIEQTSLGNYAISKFTLKVDSLTQQLASNGSMADMLRKFGYGHFRGYGPGGLTTASFRGTGSSHTAVLWNGINLLSPLSGQLDLSHVPVSFIDDASIQTGGAASLYGNGSIGATINLNNKARFNEGLKLNSYVSIGSFQSYYRDVGVAWSGKKFISSTKIFLSDAKNDFKYLNESQTPDRIEKRDHNAFHQKGVLQQLYWQAAKRSVITAKFWYQDDSYEVPNATSLANKAQAVESNTYYRTVLGWHYNYTWFDVNYQGAYVKHDLNYQDPDVSLLLNANSTFNTLVNNLELNFTSVKNINITVGINHTWERGLVDDYVSRVPVRNRTAFFTAGKWKALNFVEVAASVRQEIVNGEAKPIAPSVTIKLKPYTQFEIYTSASRNYRIPTFNDLYWKGAGAKGNPDLKSELSLTSEVGFNYSTDTPLAFSVQGDVFMNNVDNWVQWAQTKGEWSPRNIKNVWSRGLESQADISYDIQATRIGIALKYTFTKSTNKQVDDGLPSSVVGKQLAFTPLHEGSVTLRAQRKTYSVNFVTSFTGKQFTDDDNNKYQALKSYALVSVWLSKSFRYKMILASLIGELNNMFNAACQSRPGYPMPGRNYKVGIKINFNKPNKA